MSISKINKNTVMHSLFYDQISSQGSKISSKIKLFYAPFSANVGEDYPGHMQGQ